MSKKRKRKTETAEIIEKACTAHIELFSNKEALIEGCNGVLEYTSEKIKLDIGEKIICFLGSNLSIGDFNLEETNIKGDIISIEFSD